MSKGITCGSSHKLESLVHWWGGECAECGTLQPTILHSQRVGCQWASDNSDRRERDFFTNNNMTEIDRRLGTYLMICFRNNRHDTLNGGILQIISEHLHQSFPVPMRHTVSPWVLYHYLLETQQKWWNVWAELKQEAWGTDIGRAELYARQARKLVRNKCPLTRFAQDRWCHRFHLDADEIPPMLRKLMSVIVEWWLPELAQCHGSLSTNRNALTQHVNSKISTHDSEDDDEVFSSSSFHNMCKAMEIQ